jgi:prepilin-type N-terminal cleavage/methylation domain-containing protein
MLLLIRSLRRLGAFTLIELLTVMTVIAILAGLILSISGYANKKGATARAETEIQALSTACESYKVDNGTYPHQQVVTTSGTSTIIPSDQLDPRTNGISISTTGAYTNASLELYEALSGDLACSGTGGGPGVRNYITDIRQDVLGRNYPDIPVSGTNQVLYLSDPFGNVYGYSTANATALATGSSVVQSFTYNPPTTMPGFNPTFDMWSTGGSITNPYSGTSSKPPGSPGDPMLQWIKNW